MRDFYAADDKASALEALSDVEHQISVAGAQGDQQHFDKHGKLIKGEGTVKLVGLERYELALRRRAGLPMKPQVKKMPASSGVKALNDLAALLGQGGIDA